jgi:hypothetical protein
VAEAVPYRPIPPGGADYAMVLPPKGADGQRLTINSNLDENATLWQLRSGWNVAALNCLDPAYQPVLDGYAAFLKTYRKQLTAANTALNNAIRKDYKTARDATKAREAYMTQVYNYFALPGVRSDFCNTALQVANEFLAAQPDDPKLYAATALPRYEAVFQNFFRQYEQYQVDSAAWDAKWGTRYGSSQPGYVAVHRVRQPGVGSALVNLNATQVASTVVDPESGAAIPVIPAQQDTVSTPVVQPVATGPGQ